MEGISFRWDTTNMEEVSSIMHWYAFKVFYNKVFEIEDSLNRDKIYSLWKNSCGTWRSEKVRAKTDHFLPAVLLFHRETSTGVTAETDRPSPPIYPSCQLAKTANSYSWTGNENFHACHFLRRERAGLFRRRPHGVQHRWTGACYGRSIQGSRRLYTPHQRKSSPDSGNTRCVCGGNCLYSPMLSQEDINQYI